jgi:hypothetical protein
VNHNFQPQRSHLNRSSGFSLQAVLPQRGHFIVHICVKGPSGVTLKIWNVDSTVASCSRHLVGIRRDTIRFMSISGSTALMEKLASKINQLKFQSVTMNAEATSRYRVISFSDTATCRTRTGTPEKNWLAGLLRA